MSGVMIPQTTEDDMNATELGLALIAAVAYRNECEMVMVADPTPVKQRKYLAAQAHATEARLAYEKALDF